MLEDAKGKIAAADARTKDLLREKEAHRLMVKAWDLALKERED